MATIQRPVNGQYGGWARWLGGAMLAASLLLSGCVTGGFPGQGGYPGGSGYPGSSGYPGEQRDGGYGSQRVLGTVQDIDLNNGRLLMTGDSGAYGSSRIEVTFDRNTQLVYQGRVQSINGLERGDRISVDALQSQGRLHARQIEVVQNVRDAPGGGYNNNGQLRGVVNDVDPRNRLITLGRDGYSGGREQVSYDDRTQVEYRGQRFRPEQLDAGDVVRIQARRWGNGWLAEWIWVEVDARSR